MGSSGGSSNYKQPTIPVPPNVAGYGSSVPFTPNFVNFLGDPNVPSTGLTPAMLQQIDSGAYAKPLPAPPAASPDRDLMAQILAQLQKPQQQRRQFPASAYQSQGGSRGDALRQYDRQGLTRWQRR